MVPDSPKVQWIRPDPIVDSFLRTTLLGVALLWGGLFLVMIQGYGDCGSTAAEQVGLTTPFGPTVMTRSGPTRWS